MIQARAPARTETAATPNPRKPEATEATRNPWKPAATAATRNPRKPAVTATRRAWTRPQRTPPQWTFADSCEGGATQCSGDAVETCGLDGVWGTPWTCATGTCTDGGCVGSTTTAPSCAPGGPGMTNCGLGGSGAESCCTSPEVTGGTFYLSDDLLIGEDGAAR